MSNQIPSFLDPSRLTILSTRTYQEKGQCQELVAKDPEGDRVTITHWTETVGMLAKMPEHELRVQVQSVDGVQESIDLSKDDLVQLSYGLTDAQEAQGLGEDGFGMPSPSSDSPKSIDKGVVAFLVNEVANRGGVVRGF